MEVLAAIKCLKEHCRSVSAEDCQKGNCEILNIIGDCVFNEVPEEWELTKIK